MIDITLSCNAYPCSGTERLPTVDGQASIFVMSGDWYQAEATDGDGNDYIVYWDILDGWDGEDGGDACDWDNPTAIVRLDPWQLVTDTVRIQR